MRLARLAVLLVSTTTSGCFCNLVVDVVGVGMQRDAAERRVRRAADVERIRAGCYEVASAVVYDEVFAVIGRTYKLTPDSERRAFIESTWSESTPDHAGTIHRTRARADFEGDTCIRVVVNVSREALEEGAKAWLPDRPPSEHDLYVIWKPQRPSSLDDLYVAIDKRLKERVPKESER